MSSPPEVRVSVRQMHRWVGFIEVPLEGRDLHLWKNRAFDQFQTQDVSYTGPVCGECGKAWPDESSCSGELIE